MYEDLVIEQRQQGKLTLGEAAKLLGLTYTEFFQLLPSYRDAIRQLAQYQIYIPE